MFRSVGLRIVAIKCVFEGLASATKIQNFKMALLCICFSTKDIMSATQSVFKIKFI